MHSRMKSRVAGLLLATLVAMPGARAEPVKAEDLMRGFPPPPDAVVTAALWRTPPYNVWAFQNVERIVPTRTLFRGHGPASSLPAAGKRAVDRYRRAMAQGGFDLPAYIKANHVDAYLVMKGGRIVDEHYGNGQQPETRHIMMSVGKSYLGTVAALLVEEGTLDENQLAGNYVPELRGSAYGDATVRQVMDMLVAVEYSEAMDDPYSDVNQFLYVARLGSPPPGVTVKPGLYDFVRALKKKGEHGQTYQYVTATSEALAWIVARATGKSWADHLEERIFQKLRPERDAFVIVDAIGTQTGAGGLAFTLRDVGRFAQMLANNGRFNGQQILPERVVARIRAGGNPGHWHSYPWETGVNSYTSQWYVDTSAHIVRAMGIHGQLIEIDYDNDQVVVVQSSWPSAAPPDPAYWTRHYAFGRAVAAALR